jgi:hypothetical protein
MATHTRFVCIYYIYPDVQYLIRVQLYIILILNIYIFKFFLLIVSIKIEVEKYYKINICYE